MFALIVVHACVHPAFETARFASWIAGVTDRDTYLDGFGIPGAESRAARHIQARTTDDDEVAMWGWNTAIVYMSGRRVATRFGFSMPLLMGGDSPTRAAYRHEFMEGLRRRPPRYVVDAPQSEMLLGGHFDLSDFPELADFLKSRYVEEARFGELKVLRRVDGPEGLAGRQRSQIRTALVPRIGSVQRVDAYPIFDSVSSHGSRGPSRVTCITACRIPRPCSTSRYMARHQDQYVAATPNATAMTRGRRRSVAAASRKRNGVTGTMWRTPLLNCMRLNWFAAVKRKRPPASRRMVAVSRGPTRRSRRENQAGT